MIVLRRIPSRPFPSESPVAAIGIFDGVHRGHQAILGKAAVRARITRGIPMAITFEPHPLAVLAPGLVPPKILSLQQRLDAFAACGIRATLVIPFTRSFSRWSPEDFVQRLLVKSLKVREVVVGHDFGFGHGRSGTIETLKELGARYGFKVHVIPPFKIGGERIASHRIRKLIGLGHIPKAAQFLGRPVTVVGRVIRGENRGRALGFPTANLDLQAGVLPSVGVYAVRGKVRGRSFGGMANIGFRPTFKKRTERIQGKVATAQQPLLEVHVFGLKRLLYGQEMEVSFIQRLRSERRFHSANVLARQLGKDAFRAKKILAKKKSS